MNKTYRFFFLLTLMISLLFCSSCNTTTNVMVRSWAQDDYRKGIDAVDAIVPVETYVLMRGQCESGAYANSSVYDESKFMEIVTPLADALAAKNFRMVKRHETPDLLIVVHWGETIIDTETLYYEFEDEEGFAEEIEFEQITPESLKRNALILGTVDNLYGHGARSKKDEALNDTSEERYYFICIAFDFKDILKKKKTVKWVTQFSTPSTGTSYMDALPSMMRVASDFLGTNAQELSKTRTELGNAEVIIGDIEVIGFDDPQKK